MTIRELKHRLIAGGAIHITTRAGLMWVLGWVDQNITKLGIDVREATAAHMEKLPLYIGVVYEDEKLLCWVQVEEGGWEGAHPPITVERLQKIILGEDMPFEERDAILYQWGADEIIKGIVVKQRHFPEERRNLGIRGTVPVLLKRNPTDITDGEWALASKDRLIADDESADKTLLSIYNRKAAAHMLPHLDRRVVGANIK
tara:strand:+ start:884 stop:1486 length:603 start_codon:yes stop_codon:yes gene_type:complete